MSQTSGTRSMSQRQTSTAYIDFLTSVWHKKNQVLVMYNTVRAQWPTHSIQIRGMIEILGLLHQARQDIQATVDFKAPEVLKLWRHRIRVVRRQTDAELQMLAAVEHGVPFDTFGLNLELRDSERNGEIPRQRVKFSQNDVRQRLLEAADEVIDMIFEDLSPQPYAERIVHCWELYASTPLDPIVKDQDRHNLQWQADECRRKVHELYAEHRSKVASLRKTTHDHGDHAKAQDQVISQPKYPDDDDDGAVAYAVQMVEEDPAEDSNERGIPNPVAGGAGHDLPEDGDTIEQLQQQFEQDATALVRYTTSRLQNMVHEIIQTSEPNSG